MSPIAERLYQLLPSFYRSSDFAQGEPLRALLGVLETELQVVRDDVDGLYDNWFIETCDPWVVAYLGNLVGADALPAPLPGTDDERAYVANTVAYRRRKGTAAALSAVVGDLSTWPARGVELFRLVATQQSLNHPRPQNLRTPSLRQGDTLLRLGTPFDTVARSVDVRRPGQYSLGNIGVFVWRLKAYPVTAAPAAPASTPGGYWFDVLGRDRPLFNPLRTLSGGAAVSEATVPARLVPAFVAESLAPASPTAATGVAQAASPYFDKQPAFQIVVGKTPVAPSQIVIADLSTWQVPAADAADHPIVLSALSASAAVTVAVVDLERGRLVLTPPPASNVPVSVSYSYGFASEVGGGFYDRGATLTSAVAPATLVGGDAASAGITGTFYPVTAPVTPRQVTVQIADSLTYTPTTLPVPDATSFTLQAANKQRPLLRAGQPWSITLAAGASLTLSGLLIDTDLTVTAAGPATLSLVHCTLVPGHTIVASGPLTLTLTRAITGAVSLDPSTSALSATDSILDGAGGQAVTAGQGTLTRCTVIGSAALGSVTATDTLFCGALALTSTATGSMSTTFVPDGTAAPGSLAASRCQPARALSDDPDAADAADAAAIVARVQPSFTSTTYGHPGYAQLRRTCALEILQGGSDQSEMGVFHHLYQPQMEANVIAGLGNYLRLGLSPTVFFVT